MTQTLTLKPVYPVFPSSASIHLALVQKHLYCGPLSLPHIQSFSMSQSAKWFLNLATSLFSSGLDNHYLSLAT